MADPKYILAYIHTKSVNKLRENQRNYGINMENL